MQPTSLADALDLSRSWDRWFRQQNLDIIGMDPAETTEAEFGKPVGERRAGQAAWSIRTPPRWTERSVLGAVRPGRPVPQ